MMHLTFSHVICPNKATNSDSLQAMTSTNYHRNSPAWACLFNVIILSIQVHLCKFNHAAQANVNDDSHIDSHIADSHSDSFEAYL